tara:strand:- start:1201 stop:2142 length:942 start_codon:yes stop_codon:yes gene_type:complete
MSNIVVMGECMVEFGKAEQANLYKKSFAGDVFNTGVYIKRCIENQANVSFLSVVGDDEISDQMITLMHDEDIDSRFLYRSTQDKMGLYLINVDNKGERSFTYWRETSAAKKLMHFIEKDGGIDKLNGIDTLFFSGISIAILPPEDLFTFWQYVAQLKSAGTHIVFDPNYRPALWPNEEAARSAFNIAFSLANVALPGVDDHIALYKARNAEDVADLLEEIGVDEVVIKNGSQGILVSENGQRSYLKVEPVKEVIDTTSAGDAFNGGYLSARLMKKSVTESALFAANVAKCVIQHKGAIVDKKAFAEYLINHPM